MNSEVLCAATAGYLMLALLWASAYVLVGKLTPGAFAFTTSAAGDQKMQGFTSLYFSVMTLATVGYGDIVPVSNAARMLAMMQAMSGTFYVAVLIARLVSLYAASQGRPAGLSPASASARTPLDEHRVPAALDRTAGDGPRESTN